MQGTKSRGGGGMISLMSGPKILMESERVMGGKL